ncbi:MAG TPA: hypothetical protein VMD59_21090 [Acidimicrobiales bacterium]|nr:hypothetical protein [Acidimicrobiales bacterium]
MRFSFVARVAAGFAVALVAAGAGGAAGAAGASGATGTVGAGGSVGSAAARGTGGTLGTGGAAGAAGASGATGFSGATGLGASGGGAPSGTRPAGPTSSPPGDQVYSFGDVGGGFGGKIVALEHDVPTPVRGIPDPVVQIATSNSDSYALTSSGTVWAWGAGGVGELGNARTSDYTRRPVEVLFPPGVRISFLANPMPYDSAIAVDMHGHAWGWGFNWSHTLCLAGTVVEIPEQLPLSDVTLATGAGTHSLFDAGGHVVACGTNHAGALGNGTTAGAALPTPVIGLPSGHIAALESSWQGSGALMDDGSYYDWDFNHGGQLGDGTTANSSLPVRVQLPAPVVEVSQGGSRPSNGQTLAVLADGSVWAWGTGRLGQLGIGSYRNQTQPVRIDVPNGVRFVEVASGGDASYALDRAGQLWAWGGDHAGQLGDGLRGIGLDLPFRVGLQLTQISATATNVAALG